LAKLRDMGISANVGLRRDALLAVGGFDEMLAPGSYFSCAEDYDLTYRVLAKGYMLLHLPSARVLHHGLRDWRSGSALMFHTYVATGAAYMKHLRVRDIVGLVLLLQEFERATLNVASKVWRGRRPFGVGRMFALCVGMWRSSSSTWTLARSTVDIAS
jgi:GT2 family glycosyltransferase